MSGERSAGGGGNIRKSVQQEREHPGKTVVMLSAFVCPGVGQYFQGRWFAALLYFVPTLALMFWLFWISVVPVYRNVFTLLESTDPTMGVDLTGISFRDVGWTLLWILIVYLANLLDIVIVNRHRMRTFIARTTPPDLQAGGR